MEGVRTKESSVDGHVDDFGQDVGRSDREVVDLPGGIGRGGSVEFGGVPHQLEVSFSASINRDNLAVIVASFGEIARMRELATALHKRIIMIIDIFLALNNSFQIVWMRIAGQFSQFHQ
jgi:hypothetical protein